MIKLRSSKKKISVLITVFNGEDYIKKCLVSLKNQTYKNWEAIIIDDKSTDNTLKIIKNNFKDKRFKITALKKNIGRIKAANYGLTKCKGDYIAILDSDDISHKNRFKKQIAFFEKNKKANIVVSWAHQIDKNGKIIGKFIGPVNPKIVKKQILFFNFIPHSTLMYCRKFAKKIKAIPYRFRYAIDYELYLKFLRHTDIYVIPEFLGNIRFLKNSITNAKKNRIMVVKDDLICLDYVKKHFDLNFKKKFIFLVRKIKLSIKLIIYKLNLF